MTIELAAVHPGDRSAGTEPEMLSRISRLPLASASPFGRFLAVSLGSSRTVSRTTVSLALAASLCAGGPVVARSVEQAPPTQAIADAPDIVVEGQSPKSIAPLVDKLAVSDQGRQVARWTGAICIKIDGMALPFADVMRARIAEVAQSLELRVLGPKCPPNITIQLTDQSDTIIRSLLDAKTKHRGSFNDDQPRSASERAVLLAPRAVRWMSITETRDDSGAPFVLDEANQVHTWSASLIAKTSMEAIAGIVIVIDESKLVDVTMTQLSDYLALVALARPALAADYRGDDSIMSLFEPAGDRPKPAGMTTRDNAFLSGLYGGPAAVTARQRKAAIRRRMVR